jgi:hypothetical protein
MTRNPHHRSICCVFLLSLVVATGCTSLQLPALPFGMSAPLGTPQVSGEFQLQPSASEQVYQSVKQARSQNAIVLQIVGDSTPVRILPLPTGDKSVFVSDLLKQSGVTRKLGSVEATLFRNSSEAIGGIPLSVKMDPDGRSPRPESDYALHPGDRLRVHEAPSPALKGLFNAVLGR